MQLWSVVKVNCITNASEVVYEHLTNRDASISKDRLQREDTSLLYYYKVVAEPEED